MDLNKIKGKIREKQKTYVECAKYIGISTASFCDKMNGKRKFYIDELDKLGDFLGLSPEEKASLFLH